MFLHKQSEEVEMKKAILSLIFALSACGAQPAFAKADYSSPLCELAISSDMSVLRGVVIKELEKAADKNQLTQIKNINSVEIVVAATNLFCENLSAKETLEWIGL
ncbi:hypothetical protein [Klebsiella phage vB_Kpn_P545]|uniref:Spackle periplasmic protein n=1 Tax=Klebsiella phage vB_Kpn_P545 TaxID=2686283 RepID=A0A6B9J3Y6_9CAUD|nr:hypothetical protein [Klebsiella phage vB_Kpn_P545]